MFDWKHWRLTIDGTATDFDLDENDQRELAEYPPGVSQQVMLEAMKRWSDAGTADKPRGWSHDEETGTIEAWAPDRAVPGLLVSVSVFSDTFDTGYTAYDLSFVTTHKLDAHIRFRLEPRWPELEKQSAAMKDAGIISGFIDNLPENVELAKLDYERSMQGVYAEPLTASRDLEKLLAAHFEIDLQQVEIERGKLLDYVSRSNEAR